MIVLGIGGNGKLNRHKPVSENIYFYVADLEVPLEMSVKLALTKT